MKQRLGDWNWKMNHFRSSQLFVILMFLFGKDWQFTFDLATLIFVQKNQTFNRMNLLICITILIENYKTSTWLKKSWNVYRGHSMHAFHE